MVQKIKIDSDFTATSFRHRTCVKHHNQLISNSMKGNRTSVARASHHKHNSLDLPFSFLLRNVLRKLLHFLLIEIRLAELKLSLFRRDDALLKLAVRSIDYFEVLEKKIYYFISWLMSLHLWLVSLVWTTPAIMYTSFRFINAIMKHVAP